MRREAVEDAIAVLLGVIAGAVMGLALLLMLAAVALRIWLWCL